MRDIILPTARGMVAEGRPYRGVIFAGLMIKEGRARLLEFNVRFGDPECQVLMMRMQSDLVSVLEAAWWAMGEVVRAACAHPRFSTRYFSPRSSGRLSQIEIDYSPDTALTVVMAAAGYPGSYKKVGPLFGVASRPLPSFGFERPPLLVLLQNTVIGGLDKVTSAKVFHAGTGRNDSGQIVATGGRVLNVTASGKDVVEAQRKAYEGVRQIQWPEGFCRSDIGWRAVARAKGQPLP